MLHSKASGRAEQKEVGSRLHFQRERKEKRCWNLEFLKKEKWGFALIGRPFGCKWLLIWAPAERGDEVPIRACM